MASLNKVIILGNAGKTVDLRYTTSGQAVASFSVATSEKFKNKEGGYTEKTEWHKISLWGRQAELAGEYIDKGTTVLIEGRLQTRKWTDRDGNEKYTTEIVGDRFQVVGGKRSAGEHSTDGDSVGATDYSTPSVDFDDPDSIPF
ncbi:single-stranded DNA-binding protein (plasmid) [Trichlorobacter lovleyi]|uniref:single-stranded DNA-binding protein n=1 Tax=Trichlorobacter lovleyi TaxID=313985 RepID=UPI0022409DCA|nr:single-stranded DNA-binding protein [Trichlorobacter lovleyi]QOX80830.1 single-stranded DNA-binding protein [Trichlorobacter lovleyi]